MRTAHNAVPSPLVVGVVTNLNFGSVVAAVDEWKDAVASCTALEFRADTFRPAAVLERLGELRSAHPSGPGILFTLRLRVDGGGWTGGDRGGLWRRIAEDGLADWVDVELEAVGGLPGGLWEAFEAAGIRRVLSHHDVGGSPDATGLEKLINRMSVFAPEIMKLATTPRTPEDVRTLLACVPSLAERCREVSVVAMGPWGPPARTAAVLLGARVTYAYLVRHPAAPGQREVREVAGDVAAWTRALGGRPTAGAVIERALVQGSAAP